MDAHEELVDAIKEIIATGCSCDRHCDGMTGPDVYCGCECDARAAISAVAEALSKPTEEIVKAWESPDHQATAAEDWRVMLAASPLYPKGE